MTDSKPRRYPWQKTGQQRPAARDDPVPTALAAPVPRLALSIRELAASLGVAESTVAGWLRAGSAPPSFVAPGGKRRLFPVAAVEQWLADQAGADDDSPDRILDC